MPISSAPSVRGRRVGVALGSAIVLTAVIGLIGYGTSGRRTSVDNLPTKTAEVADVTVKVTPERIGPDDAVFRVSFVSESSDLRFPVEAVTALAVDGVAWERPTWDGDLLRGQSREGRLEFRARGPAEGRAVLRIEVLGEPLTFSWPL